MNTTKSFFQFLSSQLLRSKCLSIILCLVFTSQIYSELRLSYEIPAESDVNILNSVGSDPSEWIICRPTSWEDLKNYLPEAKITGVSVSVILLPPFQSTPICSDGAYSEPFQNDYIRWAQEIAKLSLRYSNLVCYGIVDLRENLDLDYLTHDYVNQIMTAGKSINPRLQFITPNKNFYVDRDATGTGDGTTWTNASTSVAGLPWATVASGDTVYISGGTDSTVYERDSIYNKSINGLVTITKGWEANHNGDVIFRPTRGGGIVISTGHAFLIYNTDNIKLLNLTFDYELGTAGTGTLVLHTNDNIYVDSCNIWSNGKVACLYGYIQQKDFVRWCDIETFTNNYVEQQDNIQFGNGTGGHTFTGNRIIARGTNITPHKDIIQYYHEGHRNNYETVFANNFCFVDAPTGDGANGLWFDLVYSNRFLIFNNIILSRENNFAGINIIDESASYNVSARIYNNTIITKTNSSSNGMRFSNVDTLIIKNNIISLDRTADGSIWFNLGFNDIDFLDVDYNHYYFYEHKTWAMTFDANQNGMTWVNWKALGYDANSDTGSVNFANKWGTDLVDYLTTTGRDTGVDLSEFFKTDIRGVVRTKSTAWDKGAIER
jgi:hypothetical protein